MGKKRVVLKNMPRFSLLHGQADAGGRVKVDFVAQGNSTLVRRDYSCEGMKDAGLPGP
jgi:hypothetical protein